MQGPFADAVLREHRQSGEPIPEEFVRPTLYPGLEFYLRAFWELSTCRPVGLGESAIPFTAIAQYADELGVEGGEREELRFFVRTMDREYLALRRKEGPGG